MGAIFGILALICFLAAAICGIWLLVVIFQDGGVLWGLGSIFIPFVSLIYVVMNWGDRVKKPFLYSIGAWVLGAILSFLGGGSMPTG